MAKILVVEDDFATAALVQTWMEHQKHVVELVSDGDEALDRLFLYDYDLIVLDWNIPGKSGIEVCKGYRSKGGKAPLIMLTSKGTIQDKSEGLIGGADDYLTKPFDINELSARIVALLRRSPDYVPNEIVIGDLRMDCSARRVYANGTELHLLPKEFALLETLMKRKNQLLSPDTLLNIVWSSESESSASVVKAHIHNLRKKLAGLESPHIKNVHGQGYKLE